VKSLCEHGNKTSGPYKSRIFFDKLSDSQLVKKYLAPWSE
jgi:hypothetical protein